MLSYIILLLLGAIEIFYGTIIGRFQVKAVAGGFYNKLQIPVDNKVLFWSSLKSIEGQWDLLTWFGVATIIFSTLVFLCHKKSLT